MSERTPEVPDAYSDERRVQYVLSELLALMVAAQPHAHAVYHRDSPCCNPEVFGERLSALQGILARRTPEMTPEVRGAYNELRDAIHKGVGVVDAIRDFEQAVRASERYAIAYGVYAAPAQREREPTDVERCVCGAFLPTPVLCRECDP